MRWSRSTVWTSTWTSTGPWRSRGFSGETCFRFDLPFSDSVICYLKFSCLSFQSFSCQEVLLCFLLLLFLRFWAPYRFGYFGRGVSLMFCKVSGCLTDGRVFLSVSGEDTVSVHSTDTAGIRMLQKDDVEVWIRRLLS